MPSKSSRNRGFNYSALHIYTYTYKSKRGESRILTPKRISPTLKWVYNTYTEKYVTGQAHAE